jgi:hypothetical protein
MEDFLHAGPPFARGAGFQRTLHRLHYFPPFLRLGIGRHLRHVRLKICAVVFKIAERQVIFEEDGFFGQGLVQCTTPAPGNSGCITPSDLAPFGIAVTNSGPIPPGSVLFSNQRNYHSPSSQQVELGIEREIAPGLSMSVRAGLLHYLRWHSSFG